MHFFILFLTYGIVVWGSTFENLLNPIRVAHKKVLRAMTFSDPTAHSSPLFYNLKILKLDDLYQLSISVFAYECQNNIAPLYFITHVIMAWVEMCYSEKSKSLNKLLVFGALYP